MCFMFYSTQAKAFGELPVQVEFLGHQLSVQQVFNENNIIGTCDKNELDRISDALQAGTGSLLREMQRIRADEKLCDWLFYQLIRKTSAAIAPKEKDYFLYTVTKWHLLKASGYDPILAFDREKILLYVRSMDIVYNLPIKQMDGKQYVCLNYHDYGYALKPGSSQGTIIRSGNSESGQDFNFAIDRLPEFPESAYGERDLAFSFGKRMEHLKIRINEALKGYLINYPVTEYSNQFNIPLSKETRSSLIEPLRQKLRTMDTRKGLEYLLQFTRHAFLFAPDTEIFGREKRLSPEETLLYDQSDCEDRSALFFCLVKEIYDLPMLVITYPEHVTIAVRMDATTDNAIIYNGASYIICEPTPQRKELKVGEMLSGLHDRPYQVSYAYEPGSN